MVRVSDRASECGERERARSQYVPRVINGAIMKYLSSGSGQPQPWHSRREPQLSRHGKGKCPTHRHYGAVIRMGTTCLLKPPAKEMNFH